MKGIELADTVTLDGHKQLYAARSRFTSDLGEVHF
jgi:hypothetical protein